MKSYAVVHFAYDEAHSKTANVHSQISSYQLKSTLTYLEASRGYLDKGHWSNAVVMAQTARDMVLANIARTRSVDKVELLIVVLNAVDHYLLQLRSFGAGRVSNPNKKGTPAP